MEENYIDICNTKRNYEKSLERFRNSSSVSDYNKELVMRFLRDAALGKTIIGRAKKKIGYSRLMIYIRHMVILSEFLKKNLDSVTQDDIELFIEALETDQIEGSKTLVQRNGTVARQKATFSPRYKTDIKFSVRKFYKWLWGESRFYPKIVEWIDTSLPRNEIPALSELEVEKVIDRSRTVLQRALVQVLFDGGFRIGELLNVRLRHVRVKAFDVAGERRRCFVVRVPFSKTLRRTVVLPMAATTKWLSLWLEEHPVKPRIEVDGTLSAADTEAQLFPMTGNAVRLLIARAGQLGLGKRIYPHLLRHSSATYWSNKLPWFRLCKRFGWTMTSSMPQRYIDREGVDEVGIVSDFYNEERSKMAREKEVLENKLALDKAERDEPPGDSPAGTFRRFIG